MFPHYIERYSFKYQVNVSTLYIILKTLIVTLYRVNMNMLYVVCLFDKLCLFRMYFIIVIADFSIFVYHILYTRNCQINYMDQCSAK